MMIKVMRLHKDAVIPMKMTPGAACFDFVAIDSGSLHARDRNATVYRTGIAVEIPDDYVMLIFSRSGHGFHHGIRLSNCVGVIDSDYRGEIMISLRNDSSVSGMPVAGDRIAQGMVMPAPYVTLVPATELGSTERGTNGFGSTGDGVQP